MSGRGFNLNDYVTVDERIDKFWAQYPDGAILTDMTYTSADGERVAVKATVYKDKADPIPSATGIAQEDHAPNQRGANQGSWWENCETSAIGRALANLGMSLSKNRASREEMAKVQRVEQHDTTRADERAPQPMRASTNPPAAPVPNAGAATTDDEAEDMGSYSWTAFWPAARAAGLTNWPAINQRLGEDAQQAKYSPEQVRDRLREVGVAL